MIGFECDEAILQKLRERLRSMIHFRCLRRYSSRQILSCMSNVLGVGVTTSPHKIQLYSVVPALPPRHQQPNRFQFLIRLPEPLNTLLALVVLHVICKAVDVGVVELFARHKVGRAFDNDSNFFRQLVLSIFAGHSVSIPAHTEFLIWKLRHQLLHRRLFLRGKLVPARCPLQLTITGKRCEAQFCASNCGLYLPVLVRKR
jgi:hypothetical protein